MVGQHAEEDVRLHAPLFVVKDRPLPQGRLEGPKRCFGPRQQSVDPPSLIRAQIRAVGLQQVTPIELFRACPLGVIQAVAEHLRLAVVLHTVIPRDARISKMGQLRKETHVLCLSSERKEKNRAIREAHEKRLLVDLEKLQKRVAKGKGRGTKPAEVVESIGRLKERYSRVARYYRMEYDSQTKVFRYSLDEAKRARAEKLDGSYLLKTDRTDLS